MKTLWKYLIRTILALFALWLIAALAFAVILYGAFDEKDFPVDDEVAFKHLRGSIAQLNSLQLDQISPLHYYLWPGFTDGSEIWRFRPRSRKEIELVIQGYRLEKFSPAEWKKDFSIPWETFENKKPDWISPLDHNVVEAYAFDAAKCAVNRSTQHCNYETFLWQINDSDWMLYTGNW